MKAARYAHLLTVICGVLLVGSLGLTQRTLIANGEDDQTLQGSWDITITTPPGLGPFKILRTVSTTGVVDAYAFPPFTPTPGAVNSAGHGSWERISNRTYSVTVKYFQLNYAASPNVLDSIGVVRETITLSKDGKSYTSHFETTISLPNGQVIITNAGATTGTRIEVDPL